VSDAGLNEYDFQAVLSCFMAHQPEAAQAARAHPIQLLRAAMQAWARDLISAPQLETWAAFQLRVHAAIKRICRSALDSNEDALVLSSGGVISLFVQRALGFDDSSLMSVNMAIKNTAISEFRISRNALSLQSFNTLPHFADPEFQSFHTLV
jgi:broad specificity phosphatase PhoE